MAESLKTTLRKRGFMRTQITKLYNSISTIESKPIIDLRTMKLEVERLQANIVSYDDEVMQESISQNPSYDIEEEMMTCETYKTKFFYCSAVFRLS